ncbi:TetR/AcrR family transcriptional regulator [Larsenimonas suaedae]|uniref:TetR/AcrR family transcriptional regulator n=1 Tax=Larsenimonas suaedae TaxID=1851019 RepID=A0ABU1GTF8_9GAMM|nr:TetR/AcrR family transcriptional regulator [Larsenimonas suaedae]MCM2971739.1 TetR/AcrR family transcriptional regulator [Larsenimonas suaedae]MDR5895291.1 TetR/AcrR family transcriptional regulator [Larsenimonas suaedae]
MSSKRQQLIETAFTEFYRDGIHAVGINQILTASGIAKKTLYTHFDSKENLVLDVVDYWDNTFVDWLAKRLAIADTPTELSDALFDALDDWQANKESTFPEYRGCFFVNTAAEYSDPNHPTHVRCAQHKRRVRALLDFYLNEMDVAQSDRSQWCDTLCLLKEGVISQTHIERDSGAPARAKTLANTFLNA